MRAAERKNRFLKTVREALGRPPGLQPDFAQCYPDQRTAARAALIAACRRRSNAERQQLLAALKTNATPLHIQVQALPDGSAVSAAIVALIQSTSPEWGEDKRVAAWFHPLVASLGLEAVLAEIGVPLITIDAADPQHNRRMVAQCYVGITAADLCVADTATLVMKARPGQARSVSLVPSIHVAVITLDQIVRDLEELYALLRNDLGPNGEGLGRCTTFISGPSKTADIELTMVHGAHGPRALHLFVITG